MLANPFLLDAAPAATATVPAWLAYVGLFSLVVSVLSITLNVILALRKEAREDGQTVTQRLKKVEGTVANHDQQRAGEVQARERLAADMQREYQALKEDVGRRCTALEGKADEVQHLRERMASMEADLKRLPSIESKVDELLRLLAAKI